LRTFYNSFCIRMLVLGLFTAFGLQAALPERSLVVEVHDRAATEVFRPRQEPLGPMMRRGISELLGSADAAEGLGKLVGADDIVGIKVYALKDGAGGVRPEVVRALIELLGEAGVPAEHIVIWDRSWEALYGAGFVKLAQECGVRVEATAEAGFDKEVFYSSFFPSSLVYGDVEFAKERQGLSQKEEKSVEPAIRIEPGLSADEEQPGRRSFVSRLLSQEVTRIILVTPLLHHNSLGATGHIYSLASGSTDNFLRFEADGYRLAEAATEIYAMEAVGDKVVLCITDALFCQYRGQSASFLHYTQELNELWFSRDPVALDARAFRKMMDIRRDRAMEAGVPMDVAWAGRTLLENALLLELGNASEGRINVRRFELGQESSSPAPKTNVSPKEVLPAVEKARSPWWKFWKR
jgi:hypothetical protein